MLCGNMYWPQNGRFHPCCWSSVINAHSSMSKSVKKTKNTAPVSKRYTTIDAKIRAVQDYDLYWIHIDYFKRIWLQYASSHILSNMITVEYDTITLWLQYNMMPVFNHNIIGHLGIWFGTCWSATQFLKPKISIDIFKIAPLSKIYHVNIF